MLKAGLLFNLLCMGLSLGIAPAYTQANDYSADIQVLIKKMTLEEKVGQLNQYSDAASLTGDLDPNKLKTRETYFQTGWVGSMLNVSDKERMRTLQKYAVEKTRLGIPLLFAFDVIHSYRTSFPIPLAAASSWDITAVEQAARISAIEAAASGINWTFAPMVDISRDPRWGRVMEGAGEDPHLTSEMARAQVRGFQGAGLTHPNTIAATAKHFVGYGAVMSGRDYNTVDIS